MIDMGANAGVHIPGRTGRIMKSVEIQFTAKHNVSRIPRPYGVSIYISK